MGKPKTEKQSLQDFLKGDAFDDGDDWADDEFDISNVYDVKAASTVDPESGMGSFRREPRQRVEYPVPEVAPFKAHVNNLPWDADQEGIVSYFTENLEGGESAIIDMYVPLQEDNTVKGVAFITFATKDQLLQALDMSGQEFNGRKVYVNVAAPGREGASRGGRFNQDSFDWSVKRGPRDGEQRRNRRFGDEEERAPQPEFDWGARRGPLPELDDDRQRRSVRRQPREGEDLDWASRDDDKPRRNRRFGDDEERAPQPEFDWSAKRGPLPDLNDNRPPRRSARRQPREGEDLDWASRDDDKPRRNRRFGDDEERAPQPEFDWSARRGPLPDLEDDQSSRRSSRRQQDEGKKGKRFGKDRASQPEFDWGVKRGPSSNEDAKAGFTTVGSKASRKNAASQSTKSDTTESNSADSVKPMQSSFAVLSVEDDE